MSIEDDKKRLEEITDERNNQSVLLKNKLMTLRSKTIKSIKTYRRKVETKQQELFEINEQICTMFGHQFTPWEENPDQYLDRSWYYERTCTICGKKEKMNYEPDEYITKDNSGNINNHRR